MANDPIPSWDPRSASVLRDQRRAYDEMRERCPVAFNDFSGWSLFRHQDVVSVVSDPETYSSVSTYRAIPNGLDAPEHTRYRSVLDPYLGPEQMSALEPNCRTIAVALLQGLVGRDEVNFITDYAQPFPFKKLCTFTGLAPETWHDLRYWAIRNQEQAFSGDNDEGAALAHEFTELVTAALRVRRTAGGESSDDIIAGLMEETALSDEDVVSVVRNWTASCSTVAAALGILVSYLAEHGEIQAQLRNTPALLPAAIEEILRTDGPLVANRRTATRDVEIAGQKISAGESLSLNWIAANRDGRTYDEPDAARIDRDPGDNLLFGAGTHYCQGVRLARLEMRVAMEELLACTTMIESGTGELGSRDVNPSNGFRTMPVRLR